MTFVFELEKNTAPEAATDCADCDETFLVEDFEELAA